MARVIAVANQKGGVGKTTSTVNIGTVLAQEGFRVLLVDLDPQAGLTISLGFSEPEEQFEKTITDAIDPDVKASLRTLNVKTKIPRLFLVPANKALISIEFKLIGRVDWGYLLQKRLAEVTEDYDFILIDCPPWLGLLSHMAIIAADVVLVPVQAEFLALRGIELINWIIERMLRESENSRTITRYFLTLADKRNKHTASIEKSIRETFGDRVLKTSISRTVKFADSSAAGVPLTVYDASHSASQSYRALVKEILENEQTEKRSRSKNRELSKAGQGGRSR
jgi:chromosome partitioning protein